MQNNSLRLEDLKIGMRVSTDQLRHIINKYMIIVYDHAGDKEGTLVFVGNKQNKEYSKWFMQDKPITPVFHSDVELEENVVYDE